MDDYLTFYEILEKFQLNDTKSIRIILDEYFSLDDLKGPKNQTLLHFFAKDKNEYDYALLLDSFVSFEHLDDYNNPPLFYSENIISMKICPG